MAESQEQIPNPADRKNIRRWILKAVSDSMPGGTTMYQIKKFLNLKSPGIANDPQTKITFSQLLLDENLKKSDKTKFIVQKPPVVAKREKTKRTTTQSGSQSPKLGTKRRLNQVEDVSQGDVTASSSKSPKLGIKRRLNQVEDVSQGDVTASSSKSPKLGKKKLLNQDEGVSQGDVTASGSKSPKLGTKRRLNQVEDVSQGDVTASSSKSPKLGKKELLNQVADVSQGEVRPKVGLGVLNEVRLDSSNDGGMVANSQDAVPVDDSNTGMRLPTDNSDHQSKKTATTKGVTKKKSGRADSRQSTSRGSKRSLTQND